MGGQEQEMRKLLRFQEEEEVRECWEGWWDLEVQAARIHWH